MMKRQVIVIGGGEAFRSEREFLAWLKGLRLDFDRYRRPSSPGWKKNLAASLGPRYEVIQLDMPNKLNVHYAAWRIWFKKFIPHLNREVVCVGHSLGALFLVKYLSETSFPKKIRAVFLVAAPRSEGDFRAPKSMARFMKQGGKIFLYQSRDDRVVPFADFEKYRKALPLHVTARIFKNRGHFNQSRFSEIVRDIKSLY